MKCPGAITSRSLQSISKANSGNESSEQLREFELQLVSLEDIHDACMACS